jgi:hypothetical protein
MGNVNIWIQLNSEEYSKIKRYVEMNEIKNMQGKKLTVGQACTSMVKSWLEDGSE